MTYKQYLDSCDDEFEKAVIIINLARKYPNYDKLTPLGKKRKLKEILNQEINVLKEDVDNEPTIIEADTEDKE